MKWDGGKRGVWFCLCQLIFSTQKKRGSSEPLFFAM